MSATGAAPPRKLPSRTAEMGGEETFGNPLSLREGFRLASAMGREPPPQQRSERRVSGREPTAAIGAARTIAILFNAKAARCWR